MTQVRRINRRKPIPPHELASFDDGIVYAIKALAAGVANEGQQRRALAWIINVVSETYESTYYPESVRDTDFASGKRWVGQQIVGLVNMDTGLLTGKSHE